MYELFLPTSKRSSIQQPLTPYILPSSLDFFVKTCLHIHCLTYWLLQLLLTPPDSITDHLICFSGILLPLDSLSRFRQSIVPGRGGKKGKSCHPWWQKIFPKSKFGTKYFQNIEKACAAPSLIYQILTFLEY